MGQSLTKRFHTPFGQMAKATETMHLHHQVQELARTVEIILGLQQNALLSINKFAEAKCIKVFTPDEVKMFGDQKANILGTQQPIIQG